MRIMMKVFAAVAPAVVATPRVIGSTSSAPAGVVAATSVPGDVLERVQDYLRDGHDISHVTVQLEGEACPQGCVTR